MLRLILFWVTLAILSTLISGSGILCCHRLIFFFAGL
jgi:hypothetical protein